MGTGERSTIPTAVRRLWGQASMGPRPVEAQSRVRPSSAISPAPAWNGWPAGFGSRVALFGTMLAVTPAPLTGSLRALLQGQGRIEVVGSSAEIRAWLPIRDAGLL